MSCIPAFSLSTCIPADTQFVGTEAFRKFCRQLFHQSLTTILHSLRPGMMKPEIACCADGHLQRVIYGLGPYIADYPEQVILACIVSGWCAWYVNPLEYLLNE